MRYNIIVEIFHIPQRKEGQTEKAIPSLYKHRKTDAKGVQSYEKYHNCRRERKGRKDVPDL